jgi:hypothetical protein
VLGLTHLLLSAGLVELQARLADTATSLVCAYCVGLLAALAYALLLELGINFFRSVFSLKWQENAVWLNSHMLKSATQALDRLVQQIAWLHDSYLSAKNPLVTLKVGFWHLRQDPLSLTYYLQIYICSQMLDTSSTAPSSSNLT